MSEQECQIDGQMDIDECIEVATSGSDGKAAVQPAPMRRHRKTVAELVRERLGKDHE